VCSFNARGGYVEETEGLDGSSDGFEDGQSESTRKVVARDLDSGQIAVVANADLRKTECVKSFFGLLDLSEIVARNGAAVLDAGGETGAGGFVPELQASLEGKAANLLFGEAGGDEGGDGVVLRCGLLAGAEFGAVIEVHTVGDMGETA